MEAMTGLGRRIRECREDLAMTREEFAEKLDVSVNFIYEVEKDNKIPSLKNFCKLCVVLGTSADYLLFAKSGSSTDGLKERIFNSLEGYTEEELLFINDVSMAYRNRKRQGEGK